MGDSIGFPLDTGGDDGTLRTGVGDSPGFSLDTRNNPSGVDFSQSGTGDSGPFTLDTGGPTSAYENNQSGFADSGPFQLDTHDPILTGFADSGGFTLDTGGDDGIIKTGSGDSGGFSLDTRDSGGGTNQPEFGFGDSPAFPLDTTDPSVPNNPPTFQSDGNLTVPENQTFVFDFNASDPDGDPLSYSLLYGDDFSLFELNSTTGELNFIATKDFENPEDNDSNNVYELTAQVSDGDANATLNLTVRVTDVFENAGPTFQSDGNLTVPENQTFVFDFNASDPDGDPLSYSLLYGDDLSLFELNSTTGELTFIATKDFENPEDNDSNNVYELTAQVSDGDANATLNLTVRITDLFENAGPSFQSDGNLTVPENQTFVFEFNATDPDGDSLSYSIVGGDDQALFDLNTTSGILTFKNVPDFESPADSDANNVYELTVQVSDGTVQATQNLNVSVTGINEPPVFTSAPNRNLPEGQLVVGEVNATDPDGDSLSYSIAGGDDQALFDLNATSGILSFKNVPDFESPADSDANNIYELTVQVSDGTVQATQNLNVSVTGINEPPVFTSLPNFNLPEGQTMVGELNATDPDGDSLVYSIAGGDDQALFEINATSGILTFKNVPDFESPADSDANNVYELTVQVSDGTVQATQNLNVSVTGINEPPVFTSAPNRNLPEGLLLVGEVNATDPDGDSLTYSITGGSDQGKFDINATSGILSFLSLPDFANPSDNNADNIYEATIQVSDGTVQASQNLTVHVGGVNDPPVFTSAANRNLSEGQLVVGELNATDPDGDLLSYSISGGPDQAKFDINATSGILSFKIPPDFESPNDANMDNLYELTVQVSDGTDQPTQNMVVQVSNLKEPPVFTSANAPSVFENQTFVTELNASDPENDNLAYSIAYGDDQALFNLNVATGALSFKTPPDFENPNDANTDNLYELTVQVSDGEHNATHNLSVSVTGVNEPPVFTSQPNLNMSEGQTMVGELNATDPDGDSLSYSITGGPDQAKFDLNATSGILSFKSPPDFEANASAGGNNAYVLTVRASDGTAESNLSLTVNVTDVYETAPNNPPLFTTPAFVNAPENQSFATDLNATDPDGDPLTYSITGGPDQAKFDLNSTTGILTFHIPPDFEANASAAGDNAYVLTVSASDGTAVANLSLTVNVDDVYETVPNVLTDLNSTTALIIAENQPIGTVVGEFNATSSNAGAPLAFFLVNGPGSAQNQLFTLDGNGTLRTAAVLDHEANVTVSIRVRVTGEDNASLEKEFLVQLLDDPSDNYLPPGNEYQTPGGNYSSPGDGYQSPEWEYQSQGAGHDYADGNGTEHNQSDTQQPHSFAYAPIIETFYFEKDANGGHRFGGKILTDGGSPVLEAGILISQRISFFEHLRLPAAVDPQTQEFTVTHYDFDPGTTYYYRTFARNAVGENKGVLRKFKTPEAIDPSAWWAGMPEGAGGWRTSGWFGTFRMYGNGWAMHQNLGWFFPAQSPDVGLWLWKEGLGWLWTDEGVYPFMHSSAKGGWLYFYGQRQGMKLFFDYESKNLMTLENE
jgi:hypothetical protein